ncbi:COG1470 family protein [Paramaledivibacter caminithermalis]|jgi:uncharacterized membrane protein|uniref:NPCBM-associated, NEW3 domain of alpha-galactosidase n=1 Tax=Paramaledivibacter caminithermalis (strain DSM 15212 / CIP 107654 / DViRD3) TaxID=1121301 RepID=A0A1M6MD88_PARC5|nr:NEW3 domain-containing protein [Paramaledivibacter caminithermalis]SHJ81379.1 NPCBM-associated, NEW3 domain of alpha-galactosidase [Paramaledivibacter caminithermalis DSM 15212]
MNPLKCKNESIKRDLKKLIIKSFSLILAMTLLLTIPATIAFAEGSLVISTPFTGLEVKAGETLEFPLKIENNTASSQKVGLTISSIPDNWKWTLEGRGKSVNKVFINDKSYENLDLSIDIPVDAKNGDYKVVVEAKGTGISDKLILDISVRELTEKDSKLSAEYPDLEGTPTTNFKYRVDLTNNSNKPQSYSLEAKVPRGWKATFSPAHSSEKIASISVEPNTNQGLDINIDPPKLISAGEYTIPIIAKSADETLKQDLKVVIKGIYEINMTTPTGRLSEDAYAGKKKEIKLVVSNTGSGDLKDIEFSSWEPKNWEVDFEPKEIDILKAGESKEIKAYIKPDQKALAGDYVVELKARTPEDSSSSEFRITVKTPTTWGIAGGLIVVGLIVGLYSIFKKYGRR